jgi:hypothetical protein
MRRHDDASRAYFRARARARNRAVALLITENSPRFAELMGWAQADTPEVTAERRAVLFAATAPERRTK